MFIVIVKKILILLLVLSITACSFFPSTTPLTTVDFEKEEQAIYSLFTHDAGGVALILQNTSSNISEKNPEQSIEFIRSGLPGISNETLENYLARNAQPSQLSLDMNLSMDYALLTAEELAEISSHPNWGELLTEKYPNSHGYSVFSRVGFNNSLDQAVIYVGNMAGPLMGAGFFYFMEKQNGEWVIKQQVMVWIS